MTHEHEEELTQQRTKVLRRVAEAFVVGIIVVVAGWLVQDQKTVFVAAYSGIAFILLLVTLFRGLSATVYWNRMEKLVWEESQNE